MGLLHGAASRDEGVAVKVRSFAFLQGVEQAALADTGWQLRAR